MNLVSLFYILVIAGLVYWVVNLRRGLTASEEALVLNQREKKTIFMFLDRLGDRLTTANLALDPTLEIITEYILEVTDAESGAAFVVDPADNQLVAKAVLGMFPPLIPTTGYVLTKQKYLSERVKRERIPMGQGVLGMAALTNQAILIADAAHDERVPKEALDHMPIRTIMVAPLRSGGKVVGVVAVVNKRGAESFTEEDMHLLLPLSDQAANTVALVNLYAELAAKQRIEQELRVAHDFQQMLLPKQCPAIPGFEISAFNMPALEVGGDYYDFFFVDDEHRYLGVVIADVSGKGIPGALIMSLVRSTIRAEARHNLSPRDVLMNANARTYQDTKENVFVTITYGILDSVERKFRFVRAGHEPLIKFRADSPNAQLISPDGIAMGMVENDLFSMTEEAVVDLDPGDLVLLYTDGVVEAMDPEEEEYGQKRFFDFLSINRSEPPKEIIEKSLEDIKEFTRGHAQHDDITMIAISVLDRDAQRELPGLETSIGRSTGLEEQG